jgi:hypothetical protein
MNRTEGERGEGEKGRKGEREKGRKSRRPLCNSAVLLISSV